MKKNQKVYTGSEPKAKSVKRREEEAEGVNEIRKNKVNSQQSDKRKSIMEKPTLNNGGVYQTVIAEGKEVKIKYEIRHVSVCDRRR